MGQSDWLTLWYWGVGQATVIGAAGLCLMLLCGRVAPAARARLALCALWLMCIAPAAMLIPIDSSTLTAWGTSQPHGTGEPQGSNFRPEVATHQPSDAQLTLSDSMWSEATAWLAAFLEGEPFDSAKAEPTVRWQTVAAWLLVGCIAWGCARLLAGQWQLKVIRREARGCVDGRLLRLGRESARVLELDQPIDEGAV